MLKLTGDQQRQIRQVTGRSVTELSIDLSKGQLSEAELDKVAGGAGGGEEEEQVQH